MSHRMDDHMFPSAEERLRNENGVLRAALHAIIDQHRYDSDEDTINVLQQLARQALEEV